MEAKRLYECPDCKKQALVWNPSILRPSFYACNECGKSFRSDTVINLSVK